MRVRLGGLPLCAILLPFVTFSTSGHACVLCQLYNQKRTVHVEKKKVSV